MSAVDPRIPTGSHPLVETIRRMQDQIRERTLLDVVGAKRVSKGPSGYSIVLPDAESVAASGSGVKLFEITALHADYLSCKGASYDTDGNKTLETTVTNVAKPAELRQLALDGTTAAGITYSFASTNARTRTFATLGGISGVPISDVLFPLYDVGNEIVAADLSASKTSATINGSPGGLRFDWEDLNVASREWVLPETVVQICILVNNVPTTRKILIRGSAVFG